MRINCITPSELHRLHLISEFREIKMLPKALLRSLNSKKGIDLSKISSYYTLNTGHGYFFYNKLQYIYNRFESLKQEMNRRGYKCESTEILKLDIPHLMNDWKPTETDMNVNRERINLRISQKPWLYKENK